MKDGVYRGSRLFGVSGSETYLVRIYKVIALFDFFTYSDKNHIA